MQADSAVASLTASETRLCREVNHLHACVLKLKGACPRPEQRGEEGGALNHAAHRDKPALIYDIFRNGIDLDR